MADDPFDRLTERQRACLRLAAQGLQEKEIAIRLGTTPAAIKERLRSARQRLGASTSRDAGRRYVTWETTSPYISARQAYPQRVDTSQMLENGVEPDAILAATHEVRNDAKVFGDVAVNERRAPYALDLPLRRRTFSGILFPSIEERPNDLSVRERIGVIASMAALIALAVALLVVVAMGVSGYLTWLSKNGG